MSCFICYAVMQERVYLTVLKQIYNGDFIFSPTLFLYDKRMYQQFESGESSACYLTMK